MKREYAERKERTEAKMKAFMADFMEVLRKHKANFEVTEHISSSYNTPDVRVEIDFEGEVDSNGNYTYTNTCIMNKFIRYDE